MALIPPILPLPLRVWLRGRRVFARVESKHMLGPVFLLLRFWTHDITQALGLDPDVPPEIVVADNCTWKTCGETWPPSFTAVNPNQLLLGSCV